MTVSELRDLLADLPGDAEVRMATQPHWPMASQLRGIATGSSIAGETQCDEHGYYSCDDCTDDSVVWLVEGDSIFDDPYAPRAAWDGTVR